MNIDHYAASDEKLGSLQGQQRICDFTGFHINCDIWELGRSENEARIIYIREKHWSLRVRTLIENSPLRYARRNHQLKNFARRNVCRCVSLTR